MDLAGAVSARHAYLQGADRRGGWSATSGMDTTGASFSHNVWPLV